MPSRKQIQNKLLRDRVHRRDPSVRSEYDKTRKNIQDYCSLINHKDIKAVETRALRLLRDTQKRYDFLSGTAPIKACALIRIASEVLVKKRVIDRAIPYSELRNVTQLAINSVISKVQMFKRLLGVGV